ncbi:MAG: hypothetical protein JNM25_18395 [Planctomycetes bacterium]|nr:hypothetical protein [Planctomycetota bacterium]
MHTFRLVVLLALAVPLRSQILLPNPIAWPLGCPVPSTIENNTTQAFTYTYCTPTVTDQFGQVVTWGICLQADLLLPPGETVTSYWNQTDLAGQQVPPGIYHVNGRPFAIGNAELALAPLGAPHPGASRSIELCATGGAGLVYALGASFSAGAGISLGCGVHLPIDFDWLLVESVTNAAVFPGFVGALDADGRTAAPTIVLPPVPWLAGITFQLAFVTLNQAAPCGFERASGAVQVTIQ